jgi:hypothetical protein
VSINNPPGLPQVKEIRKNRFFDLLPRDKSKEDASEQ